MWKTTLDVSQVLSNHTKPYQTHNYEVIWIFWKKSNLGQFFSFCFPSSNNFSSKFPNSYVPCLMSNLQCQKSHVLLKLKILIIPDLLELDSEAAPSCFHLFWILSNNFVEVWIESKRVFCALVKSMVSCSEMAHPSYHSSLSNVGQFSK